MKSFSATSALPAVPRPFRSRAAPPVREQGFTSRGHLQTVANPASAGSLLAVASGSVVTLWLPLTNEHVATLSAPTASFGRISRVAFVPGRPQLVTTSEGAHSQLSLWSLLTLRLEASRQLSLRSLAVDPAGGGRIAAVVRVPSPAAAAPGGEGTGGEKEDVLLLLQAPDLQLCAAWLLGPSPLAPPSAVFVPPGSSPSSPSPSHGRPALVRPPG